jgi:hypothetical protein
MQYTNISEAQLFTGSFCSSGYVIYIQKAVFVSLTPKNDIEIIQI